MNNKVSSEQAYFIMPKISKEEALKAIVEGLKEKNWADGAIERLDPKRLRTVYVWGYQYEGEADGSWSSQMDFDLSVTVNEKEKKVPAGTKVGGEFPDNIRFNLVVPQITDSMPAWAKEIKRGVKAEGLVPYTGKEIPQEEIVGELEKEALEFWMLRGNKVVDDFLTPLAQSIGSSTAYVYTYLGLVDKKGAEALASLDSSFDGLTNWKVKSRNNLSSYGKKVLVPFYVLEFEYNGKPCYILVWADGSPYVAYLVPFRKVASPEEQVEREMADKLKQIKLMKWGWLLAVVLFFIFNFTVALIVLAAWGVGYWVMKKPVNDRLKELRKQQAAGPEITEALLKKQLGVK